MALAQLENLSQTVDRLIASGAPSAKGDPELAALATTLASLAKVPALIDALRTSGDAQALLQLALAAQQLRSTQLALPSPEGALQPLPPCELHDFEPLPPIVLHEFLDATRSRKNPSAALVHALQTLPFRRDPRARDALTGALQHPTLRRLATAALGEGALSELERTFNPRGHAIDAQRLEAIAAIKKEAGAELYRACLKSGSQEVRLAALEALHHVSRKELERHALNLVDAEKDPLKRWLYARALLLAGTDAALERVVDLSVSGDGGRLAELLAPLDASLSARYLQLARARARTETPMAEPRGASICLIVWLITAKRPETVEVLHELLALPGAAGRSLAALHLIRLGDRPGIDAVLKIGFEDNALHHELAVALIALGPEVAFERIQPLLPKLPPEPGAPPVALDPRVKDLLLRLRPPVDPRWFEVLCALCDVAPAEAVAALALTGDPRGVPVIVEVLERNISDRVSLQALLALVHFRARTALPVIRTWLAAHPDARPQIRGFANDVMSTLEKMR